MLERQAMRAGPVHVQLRRVPCLRLINKSCVTSKRLYIARIAGPSKTATRPFPLEGKLLGCFCEVRFPLFSSWPSARIVLGNTVVRSEIYWRFISGFRPIGSNQGRSGQVGHYMQIAQCRINTGDCASR